MPVPKHSGHRSSSRMSRLLSYRDGMAYEIFDDGIRALFMPSGPVGRHHTHVMVTVESRLTMYSPRRTGRLSAAWQRARRIIGSPGGYEIEGYVYNKTEYLPYHVYGTGIYGSRGRPIEPVRARTLAWRDGGRWIHAKKVRGIKPNDFIREALQDGSPWPVEYYGPS